MRIASGPGRYLVTRDSYQEQAQRLKIILNILYWFEKERTLPTTSSRKIYLANLLPYQVICPR